MSDEFVEMDIPVSNGLARKMEQNGMRVAQTIPPSVISNQLRDELIRILQTGDANSGAFTVAVAASSPSSP